MTEFTEYAPNEMEGEFRLAAEASGKYAIQSLFLGGDWDYVGSTDGARTLYDTKAEAQSDIDDLVKDMHYYPEDWRVVPYVAGDDSKADL